MQHPEEVHIVVRRRGSNSYVKSWSTMFSESRSGHILQLKMPETYEITMKKAVF
jgi:hypothetical protein